MKQPFSKLKVARLQTATILILWLSACTISPVEQQIESTHCPIPSKSPACPTPSKAPSCPTLQEKICPSIKPRRCPVSPAARIADKLVIGAIEKVNIAPPEQEFMARIDTGAAGTSIHASNITAFERDGRDWVRFQIDHPSIETAFVIERPLARTVRIKQAGSEIVERRLVVKMTITLGSMSEQVDVSLSERATMTYPVLIGRNFLRNLAIVDVSQRLIAK